MICQWPLNFCPGRYPRLQIRYNPLAISDRIR